MSMTPEQLEKYLAERQKSFDEQYDQVHDIAFQHPDVVKAYEDARERGRIGNGGFNASAFTPSGSWDIDQKAKRARIEKAESLYDFNGLIAQFNAEQDSIRSSGQPIGATILTSMQQTIDQSRKGEGFVGQNDQQAANTTQNQGATAAQATSEATNAQISSPFQNVANAAGRGGETPSMANRIKEGAERSKQAGAFDDLEHKLAGHQKLLKPSHKLAVDRDETGKLNAFVLYENLTGKAVSSYGNQSGIDKLYDEIKISHDKQVKAWRADEDAAAIASNEHQSHSDDDIRAPGIKKQEHKEHPLQSMQDFLAKHGPASSNAPKQEVKSSVSPDAPQKKNFFERVREAAAATTVAAVTQAQPDAQATKTPEVKAEVAQDQTAKQPAPTANAQPEIQEPQATKAQEAKVEVAQQTPADQIAKSLDSKQNEPTRAKQESQQADQTAKSLDSKQNEPAQAKPESLDSKQKISARQEVIESLLASTAFKDKPDARHDLDLQFDKFLVRQQQGEVKSIYADAAERQGKEFIDFTFKGNAYAENMKADFGKQMAEKYPTESRQAEPKEGLSVEGDSKNFKAGGPERIDKYQRQPNGEYKHTETGKVDFTDNGPRSVGVQGTSQEAIRGSIKLALEKGWTNANVSKFKDPEQQRQLAIEGTANGLSMRGYTLTPEDMEAVKLRQQEIKAAAQVKPAEYLDQSTVITAKNDIQHQDMVGMHKRNGNNYSLMDDPSSTFTVNGNQIDIPSTANQRTIEAALNLVKNGGEKDLEISGPLDREVWRQGKAMDVEVKGYEPKTEDHQAADEIRAQISALQSQMPKTVEIDVSSQSKMMAACSQTQESTQVKGTTRT